MNICNNPLYYVHYLILAAQCLIHCVKGEVLFHFIDSFPVSEVLLLCYCYRLQ